MRLRINSIDLIGTSRSVAFGPGLNIITGPIASGKSTLLRMCHALLGAGIDDYPPEARNSVTALAGELTLGSADYTVVRPFVSTRTAKVDISSSTEAIRLPALQLDHTASHTYVQWLLRTLGLPEVKVPSAPTRPESDLTSVSINDYLLYCVLPQETIDNSVFGHRDAFRNIKRKYVFEILYGLYDPRVFRVQEEFNDVSGRLNGLHGRAQSFEHLVRGTPWQNRAALIAALNESTAKLATLDSNSQELASTPTIAPAAQQLRRRMLTLDDTIATLTAQHDHELESIRQLEVLIRQLESQSKRLTRAIVAKRYLTDFEFAICPRCGSDVAPDRGDTDDKCMLCLQPPAPTLDRSAFVTEQDRLAAQIEETRELSENRRRSVSTMAIKLETLNTERISVGFELNQATASYVSDAAEAIAQAASRRPRLEAEISRLKDYLQLFGKLDEVAREIEILSSRKAELEGELEQLKTRRDESEGRIIHLESAFETSLERIGIPRFGDTPSAKLDRTTYLPVVDGRRFDELSSQGLQVLVNVAHAAAHQRTCLDLNLNLPNVLLIDGLTTNVGQEGFDLERVHSAYRFLMELGEEFGDLLQIIVADGNVPPEAEQFIRLRLSEDDRLIPKAEPT